MATNFPGSLDSFTTKVDNVDSVLAAHVNNPQDAIVALQTKVGVTSSATTTSHDYILRNLPAQDTNWNAGANRNISARNYTSVVGTGTTPFVCTSTTLCSNLNADLLDGQEGSYYANVDNMTAGVLVIARGGTGSTTQNFVDLTTTQTVAGVKTFSSSPLVPTPTTATQAASKGYVDSAQVGLGSPVSKSDSVIYQAATDGFVSGYTNATSNTSTCYFYCYTDSNSSPTTVVQFLQSLWVSGAPGQQFNFCFPVKKNDYYKVVAGPGLARMTFISIGS